MINKKLQNLVLLLNLTSIPVFAGVIRKSAWKIAANEKSTSQKETLNQKDSFNQSLISVSDETIKHYGSALFGLNASKMSLKFAYERRYSQMIGVGGFFAYSAQDKKKFIPGFVSFNALAKIHLLSNSPVDVYVGPGLGITTIKVEVDNINKSFFGPVFETGILYSVTPNTSIGINVTSIYNWSSDNIGFSGLGSHYGFAQIGFSYGF